MTTIITLGTSTETHNKTIISNIKSNAKKDELRQMVYCLTGWYAPKALSMREIKQAVGM